MQSHIGPGEQYRAFIDFVRAETQRERKSVNRRMWNVFFWCFLLPAALSITLLLMVKFNLLPRRVRSYLDWLVLVFPLFYTLYVLSSEVLRELPMAFRRGGLDSVLRTAANEGDWRFQVCEGMRKNIHTDVLGWQWIATSFKSDLERVKQRAGYLTALAGAVFFFIMEGIDSLLNTDNQKVTWVKDSVLGWIETSSSDLSQFVGLGLFLVLLYLAGSQPYYLLQRYLTCAELILADLNSRIKQD